MRNLGYLLLIGLVIFTVIDVVNSEEKERSGLPQWAWILLIIVFPLIGSIVWLVASRSQRARVAPHTDGWGSHAAPAGPAAPDDDPEFLWLLEQKRRQAERENGAGRDPERGESDPE